VVLLGCATGVTGQVIDAARKPGAGDHTFDIQVGGLERRYIVHVPPGYDGSKPGPVILMFHGGGGTAQGAMRETRWAAKADKEGFLAVFPEGTRPDPSQPARFAGNPQTWNDGSSRLNVGAAERKVDDDGFVRALLDDLAARFAVDTRRIFVTGFSNGASMSFRIGRELANRVAAIAPVAGADWADEPPKPVRPVPLLYITGTADPLNPIDGG
jgi:polyhydroxybutyrate depolymerase